MIDEEDILPACTLPPSMIFKEMKCSPDILEGMLNADIVRFHGFADARHFLSSTQCILGVAHESFGGGADWDQASL